MATNSRDEKDKEAYLKIWGELPPSDPHGLDGIRRFAGKGSPSDDPAVELPSAVIHDASLIRAAMATTLEPLLMDVTARLEAIEGRLEAIEREIKELTNRKTYGE